MLKIGKYFLWVVVTLVLAGALDQALVRMPLAIPGLQQTQAFYIDFRSRLLGLVTGTATVAPLPESIDAVIERSTAPVVAPVVKSKRYLYVDTNGTLQFADSFEQVPAKYRQVAQPLAE